jgi:uncharacterized membrane protein YkvA (DUF1232 family)
MLDNKDFMERIKNFEYSNKILKKILSSEKDLEVKFKSEKALYAYYSDFTKMIEILKKFNKDNTLYDLQEIIVPIVVTLLYINKNLDELPDFLPFIGLLDDSIMMGNCVNMLKDRLRNEV